MQRAISIASIAYNAGGIRLASLALMLFVLTSAGVNPMCYTAVPSEFALWTAIAIAITVLIVGMIVMVIRWDNHLVETGQSRGKLAKKHVASGVLGMVIAGVVSYALVPYIVARYVAVPEQGDFVIIGVAFAIIAAAVLVFFTQAGFSGIKDLIERGGKGIVELIYSGEATAEQIIAAYNEAAPKLKKKISEAAAAKKAAEAEEKAQAEAIAELMKEAGPKEEPVIV